MWRSGAGEQTWHIGHVRVVPCPYDGQVRVNLPERCPSTPVLSDERVHQLLLRHLGGNISLGDLVHTLHTTDQWQRSDVMM